MSIALLSLFVSILVLVGLLVLRTFGLLPKISAEYLALALITGALIHQMLFDLGITISKLLLIMTMLAIAGALTNLSLLRHLIRRLISKSEPTTRIAVVSCILIFVSVVLTNALTPLTEWDGRSIWFFKAKIFFYANRRDLTDLLKPELAYIHPDYPILISSLAASFATLNGYWNEFVPKLVLSVPLAIIFLSLSRSASTTSGSLMRLIFLLLATSTFLINGYMDGLIALTGVIAVSHLFDSSWPEESNRYPLLGYTALIFSLYLKNEGALYALSISATYILMSCIDQNVLKRQFFAILPNLKTACFTALLVMPWVVWQITTRLLEMPNYYRDGLIQNERPNRIFELNAWLFILQSIFAKSRLYYGFGLYVASFSISIVAVSLKFRAVVQRERNYLCVVTIYLMLVGATYLFTPWELKVQIETSVQRVCLFPFLLLVWRSTYFLFAQDWKRSASSPAS